MGLAYKYIKYDYRTSPASYSIGLQMYKYEGRARLGLAGLVLSKFGSQTNGPKFFCPSSALKFFKKNKALTV